MDACNFNAVFSHLFLLLPWKLNVAILHCWMTRLFQRRSVIRNRATSVMYSAMFFSPASKLRNYEESKSTPKDPHLLSVFQKLLNFNKWQNSRQIKQVKRLRRSQRKISSSVPDVHVRNTLSSFIAGGLRYH